MAGQACKHNILAGLLCKLQSLGAKLTNKKEARKKDMLVVRYATSIGDHVVVAPATFLDLTCPHDVDTMLTVSTFLSLAVLDTSQMCIGYVA